jgi:hypothetical protein
VSLVTGDTSILRGDPDRSAGSFILTRQDHQDETQVVDTLARVSHFVADYESLAL